ncbi:TetR/AcrR family transcriptional regulator [Parablautia muri]|uniref:TetR/AcrR family transcriptional regulator n=1 Tax=Parablautia muri TaxID=2320879 RepID=A0A9X5BDI7_9FIRM|nr:TetR/AcrR family transcriptional regulator [Parablautia muri]NBJ91996.1 TetR/AcrR family transcriptional regulator [Parablautia muri]
MSESEKSTLDLLHRAAKVEFMEKGFQTASLRNIVKTAGVTTGAFYGYYDSKEELFSALVGKAYEYVMSRYRQAHEYFENLPAEKQPEQMGKLSAKCMNELLAYSYEHADEFYLILKCSEGTKYAGMIDDMVELEVESTHKYYKVLEQLGAYVPKIDERLEHIMATGMIGAFFEMVLHKMPFEDAKVFLQQLNDFYTAGWMKIMGQ